MLIALLILLNSAAQAATLEHIRVFNGESHTRILLSFDKKPGSIDTDAVKSTGNQPSSSYIIFGDSEALPERNFEINAKGLHNVDLKNTSTNLHLSATHDKSRRIYIQKLSPSNIIIDLLLSDDAIDPDLPTTAQLRDWSNGIRFFNAKAKKHSNKIVVLDAGHGGKDHGAVGVTGTREADVALQIALRAKALFKQNDQIEVILTRKTDEFISLKERALIANSANADLFISIHANANTSSKVYGIETYSLDTASDKGARKVAMRENKMAVKADGKKSKLLGQLVSAGTNRLSAEIANMIQRDVVAELKLEYKPEEIKDLGSKTALFYVLVSTKMPAVLFEASFLSNPNEERRLRTPHFQQNIAKALVKSIEAYFAKQEE